MEGLAFAQWIVCNRAWATYYPSSIIVDGRSNVGQRAPPLADIFLCFRLAPGGSGRRWLNL